MSRHLHLFVGLAVAAAFLTSDAGASDTCQRATGGKCKAGQGIPKIFNPGAVTHTPAKPRSKGPHKGRNDYTAAEREKMMERARALCRKNYGAPSLVYRIDYKQNIVWCEPPAY